jgi:hypothetical protein
MSPLCSQPLRIVSAVFSGSFPVAGHHLRTAEHDLADLAGRDVAVVVVDHAQLGAEGGAAARIQQRPVAADAGEVVLLVEVGGDRGDLGHAVALDQHVAEHLLQAFDALGGHRRGAVADGDDAARVGRAQARRFEDAEQHRRHEVRMRDALLLDELEPAVGVEVALVGKHDGAADHPGRHVEHVDRRDRVVRIDEQHLRVRVELVAITTTGACATLCRCWCSTPFGVPVAPLV